MRVLWVHNFRSHRLNADAWMHALAAAMRRAGVEVDLHATGSLRGLGRLLAVRRRITQASADYDVAHAQFGSACGVVTAQARCPRVLSLRGTEMLGCDAGSWRLRLHGQASRWMTGATLGRYARVIVMSHRMRAEVAKFHQRHQGVEVLPSGIDLAKFQAIDRREARRRLGFAHDVRPWVLFASLRAENPVKRPKLARAAFDRAQLRRTDLVLKTLHGVSHAQVPLWMNAANVLLVTSTREGWPNVVKEALACQVPFVSTDVSDLVRIAAVEPSCTVAAAEPGALAEGLLRAIDAGPSGLLRRHVEPMEIETTARRLRAIYEDALGWRRRQAA